MEACRDVASGADRHLDITFGLQVVDSLVSIVFREALNHPYISFFHLSVNGFSVIVNSFQIITPHAHARAGGYVIGAGVHIYVYIMFVDEKNI